MDDVSLEHILYAHPCVIVHLKCLFNMISSHDYVPEHFGKGVVIPLVKDKGGDLSDPENYRGITISLSISKSHLLLTTLTDAHYTAQMYCHLFYGSQCITGSAVALPVVRPIQQEIEEFR